MTERSVTNVPRAGLGLLTFAIFAFVIPWTIWFGLRAQAGSQGLDNPIAFFVAPALVSLAGFAAAFAEDGVRGLREFVGRTLLSRLRIGAFLLGPVLVIVAGLLTFITHTGDLVGQGAPDPMIWLGALTLMNLWTGPVAEEFGWRGYLLPRLEGYMPPFPAALSVGLIWATWHWPLFYDSLFSSVEAAGGYYLWVVSWSVMLAIVTRIARGNILPAVFLHLCMNTQADLFSAMLPRLDGSQLPSGMPLALASAAVALMVAIMSSVSYRRTSRA